MEYFYDRMKETRKAQNLTQKEIASILKITQQQYQLYESGKRYIPIDLLKIFCENLKISADYILGIE